MTWKISCSAQPQEEKKKKLLENPLRDFLLLVPLVNT
jgi:hypothetical protein